MLLRKKFYLQIEYHWYCINILKKQLNDSNEERNKKINRNKIIQKLPLWKFFCAIKNRVFLLYLVTLNLK